ncbi:(deoxy)nucleoside triphosphate pyrophosphohydrolase [Ferrimonas pelagia]|uniref:8-oxo-dGTP diphosphatase n=1 Tax=Ferrimonas pelagia TaxID=1177826 RepID=A0ABP9FG81_9GAMM
MTLEVVAALLCDQGRILLARRHPNASQGGYWEFPGGKIDPGESPQQALEREIAEELSVSIQVRHYLASSLHHYGDKQVNLHGYLCHWQPQPIQLTGSHDQYQWLRPEQIDRTTLAPADLPLLDALLQKHRNASL